MSNLQVFHWLVTILIGSLGLIGLTKIYLAMKRWLQGTDAEIRVLRNRLKEAAAQLESLRSWQADAKGKLSKLEAEAQSYRDAMSRLPKIDATLATRASDIKNQGTQLARLSNSLSTVNSTGFLAHQRQLTAAAAKDLVANWSEPLGLKHNERTLAYKAHKICLLEDASKGRLATAIETILVRMLAAESLCRNSGRLRVLEIGTLFGIGATAIFSSNKSICKDVSLTLIDPLSGYYGEKEPDLITGEVLTRAMLEENLEIAGVPSQSVTILQGLSTDPAIRQAAGKQEYDLLVIDGDHSYEGVKADFDNYRDLVRPGGLIVFDDYAVNEWPRIKEYVDEHIAPRADLALVNTGWRTALYRVAAPSTSNDESVQSGTVS